jgi:hypothetical protein
MESIRYSMNYENCSLRCQHISPKPLEDEHITKCREIYTFNDILRCCYVFIIPNLMIQSDLFCHKINGFVSFSFIHTFINTLRLMLAYLETKM